MKFANGNSSGGLSDTPEPLARTLVSPVLKIGIFLLSILLLIALVIYSSLKADPAHDSGRLVEKLNELHAIVYLDASSDSYQQLQAFAPYSSLIKSIRCDENEVICESRKIEETPTIVITDLKVDLTGVQTKEQLISLLKQIGIW